MPEHVVEQHETIPSIASAAGLPWKSVWQHPRNAALREARTPTILLPGDVVFVPDVVSPDGPKVVECPTGQVNRFLASVRPLKLRLRLVSYLGETLAGAACRLILDGAPRELAADGDGVVACVIPARTRTATLFVKDLELPLAVGALDPIDEPSGLTGRLATMGFDAGEPGEDEEALRWAIEEFQQSFGLQPTGDPDAAAAEVEEHFGC